MISRRRKLLAGVIAAILVCTGVYLGNYLKGVFSYKRQVRNTIITDIDVSAVADGIYTGEYDVGFIYAKVEVVVHRGEILQIRLLEHRNERGDAAEKIIDKVIKEQTLQVDAISGATNSSKVILKAIENALPKFTGTVSRNPVLS